MTKKKDNNTIVSGDAIRGKSTRNDFARKKYASTGGSWVVDSEATNPMTGSKG